MILQAAVGQDMLDRQARLAQRSADEDRAVTGERVFLRAEERDPLGPHPAPHAVEPLGEERGGGDPRVDRLPIDVAGGIGGAGTEFAPEEDIANPGVLQRGAQRGLAEMWQETAVRV